MTPCREWQGARNSKGYGNKWDKDLKKLVGIHRWVVAQIHGWEAIEGKIVMHLCDNPSCYRYDHLQIGTQADNMQDMSKKGRTPEPPTHCKRGHPYDEYGYRTPNGSHRCTKCRDFFNLTRPRRTP